MPDRQAVKLNERIVDGLKADAKAGVVWDRDLPGFGVRVYPSGRKTYVVQTRGPNGSRRVTLGMHGEITARQARRRAASAIDRIKSGLEPLTDLSGLKSEPTVADLAERCRSREMQTLKWADIDRAAGEIRLADSKTGPRPVPLTAPVRAVLDGIERESGNPWVFAGRRPGTHVGPLGQHWRRLRIRAELEDVRLHDLRHSYASRALELGESLPMIGKLLGHNRVQTTARYALLARESEKRAVAKVAASIESDALWAVDDQPVADSGGA